MSMPFEAATLGLLVGFVMPLTGAGGTVLAVPLLMFAFDLPLAQAAPVGLLAVACSSTIGAMMGLYQGVVRYRAALLMALVGILLAPAGLLLGLRLSNFWSSIALAVVLMLVGVRILLRMKAPVAEADELASQRGVACSLDSDIGRLVWTAPCVRALAIAGGASGLFSGMLGVGGGFVIVPALRRFSDLPQHTIIATSLATLAIISSSTLGVAAWHGILNTSLAWPFATGAVLGLLAGRQLAHCLTGPRLQQAFALLAVLVAMALLAKLFL